MTEFELIVLSAVEANKAYSNYYGAWLELEDFYNDLKSIAENQALFEKQIKEFEQSIDEKNIEKSIEADTALIIDFISNFPESNPDNPTCTDIRSLLISACSTSKQIHDFISNIITISKIHKITDDDKKIIINFLHDVKDNLPNRNSQISVNKQKAAELLAQFQEAQELFESEKKKYHTQSLKCHQYKSEYDQKEARFNTILDQATEVAFPNNQNDAKSCKNKIIKIFEESTNYCGSDLKAHFKSQFEDYQSVFSYPATNPQSNLIIIKKINKNESNTDPILNLDPPSSKVVGNNINEQNSKAVNQELIATIKGLCELNWSRYTRVGTKPDGLINILNIINKPEQKNVLGTIQSIAKAKYSAHFQWAHSLFRGRKEKTNDVYKILSQIDHEKPETFITVNEDLKKLTTELEAENCKHTKLNSIS